MIETATGALYSVIGLTGLFGLLLMLGKDIFRTYKSYSKLDAIGLALIFLALLELEVMIVMEVIIYFIGSKG